MTTDHPSAFDRFERWTNLLATVLVFFGGVCLVGASALTGLSVLGSLTVRSVPGEIEIVEALCGFAVYAFLPYCQLRRGHVGVDLMISAFGPKAMNWTQLIGDVIIGALIALLTWRHWVGFADKFANGETTPLLLLPIWWGFAVGLVLLAANLVTCLYIIVADLRDIRRGHAIVASVGAH